MAQPPVPLQGFLQTIWDCKQQELFEAKNKISYIDLEQQLPYLSMPLDLAKALESHNGPIKVIAEVKRASPSKGLLHGELVAPEIARIYEEAGASAISVLTEEKYFRGSLQDLRDVRPKVKIPLLRKDFLSDPYQILEARVAGADGALLIAAFLGPTLLQEMIHGALEFNIQPLIEIHDAYEIEWVIDAIESNQKRAKNWTPIVGINARNLQTLVVDKEQVLQLAAELPREAIKVAESGLKEPQEVFRAKDVGFDAILVGEALVTAPHPGAALADLVSLTNPK
ncbi:indole-3-glycerol-phosphate synthase [Heliorestis acidaminivorans]|uniref:indole-3-glycerol-phosphate synthase n=1 Tax=Heliorestis acidaminivorans TaxID=553427 RepID=A0A6I0EV32_9FIRM|nr:indole-3-glycerol phosphate synthase TrpC [Heliorestis acidaminivorans]KAB2954635.1 indole-3-glycerol-phosphate synthase [Heliorestis acidaminivorans]